MEKTRVYGKSLKQTAQMAECTRASASVVADPGLIPSRVEPTTSKLVFTASLLDVEHRCA